MRHAAHTRGLLVVAEVALAFVVLAGASLLVRSLARALAVEPGFDARGLLTLRIEPPWRINLAADIPEQELLRQLRAERTATARFFDDLLDRIGTVAGVDSVAAVNRKPLSGGWWSSEIEVFGRTRRTGQEWPQALVRVVTPRYFETMRIPLLAGRFPSAGDHANATPVAIVSETLARAVWPGQSPLVQRIRLGPGDWYRVVGVVGDVKQTRLEDRDWPTVYFNFAQAPWGHFGDWGMDVLVRTAGDPLDRAATVRARVRDAAPTLPITGMTSMEDALLRTVADRRFSTLLLGSFAALSVMLAALGLGGLLSTIVGERASEISVRSALGATPADIARLVMGDGIRLTLVGLACGTAVAMAASRAIRGLVFGITAGDPATLAAAALVLAAVALAACAVPVARALRLDPVRALRDRT